MLAQIVFFPEQASTTSRYVDGLLFLLLGVCGSVAFLVGALLIGFSIRYRHRPGAQRPPRVDSFRPLEIFWTVTPLGIFIVFFLCGAAIYLNAFRAPDNARVVYVVAKQWMW